MDLHWGHDIWEAVPPGTPQTEGLKYNHGNNEASSLS